MDLMRHMIIKVTREQLDAIEQFEGEGGRPLEVTYELIEECPNKEDQCDNHTINDRTQLEEHNM